MNPKTYNRIANGCMIAAAASALFFGGFGWYAGSVGILAGIIATWLYFYNLWYKESQHT